MENITHSLCTLEFQDNRRLYDWVLDKCTICYLFDGVQRI
ncbi:glutamate--tRNA ligase family protein [Proteus mirabilis]